MKKVLIVSYDVNPNMGSEAGKAHLWLLAIAKHYDIDVFVHSKHRQDIETFPYPENIQFYFVKTDPRKETEYARIKRYDKVNQLFLDAVEKTFIERTRSGEYEFVHFLTPSSIFAYNDFYKKADFRFVIGPLGGGLQTPKGFGKLFSTREKITNLMRYLYYIKLKHNSTYKGYFKKASRIIIGTDYLYRYLPKESQTKTVIQFDTLIDVAQITEAFFEKSDSKRLNIVFTGKLQPVKGIKMLIEALHRIHTSWPDLIEKLHLDVFGEGPLKSQIISKIAEYKLEETVTIHCRVARQEVLRKLAKSGIFCLPTIRENGGQSILEAMAAGLPIITSDYGGPKYSVSDDCGIKIPVDNYDNYVRNLADAIIKLAEDEPLRRKMGDAARKRVQEKFSLEALKRRIPEIYGERN